MTKQHYTCFTKICCAGSTFIASVTVDSLETEVAFWGMYSGPSHNSLPLQPCSKKCPSCPSSLSFVGLLRENPVVQLYGWHFFFCLCFCFILVNEWKVSSVLYLSIVFLVDPLLSLSFPPDMFRYLFERSCSG